MSSELEAIRTQIEEWLETATADNEIDDTERAEIQALLQKLMDVAWEDSEITTEEQKLIDETYDAAMERLREYETEDDGEDDNGDEGDGDSDDE